MALPSGHGSWLHLSLFFFCHVNRILIVWRIQALTLPWYQLWHVLLLQSTMRPHTLIQVRLLDLNSFSEVLTVLPWSSTRHATKRNQMLISILHEHLHLIPLSLELHQSHLILLNILNVFSIIDRLPIFYSLLQTHLILVLVLLEEVASLQLLCWLPCFRTVVLCDLIDLIVLIIWFEVAANILRPRQFIYNLLNKLIRIFIDQIEPIQNFKCSWSLFGLMLLNV